MSKIIIAGVGPGMGCSTARYLSSKGHELALVSRSGFALKLASEIGALGAGCDLNDLEKTESTFRELSEKLGGLDSLVHFAGGFYGQEGILDLSSDTFQKSVLNNAGTLFNTVKSVVPLLKENGGSITGISAARHVYYNGNAAYAAGKGAVVYMMRALAAELARYNIRVNTIAPGFINKDDCDGNSPESDLLDPSSYPSRYIAQIVESVISNPGITGEDFEIDGGVSTQMKL